MAGELRYEIDQNAYFKLVLHSFKHKEDIVNGLLIGRVSGDKVEIEDSVPLFHSYHIHQLRDEDNIVDASVIPGATKPPLDDALRTIENYYNKLGLSIVGYFHANGILDHDHFVLSSLAKEIGDHISKCYPITAILLLDYNKLDLLSNWMNLEDDNDQAPVMQLYTKEEATRRRVGSNQLTVTTWKGVGSNRQKVTEPFANDILQDHIYSLKSDDVYDFDDYLNGDIKDWLNSQLFN